MSARLAVLASGRGSNLKAILDAIHAGTLDASVVVVISNNVDAGALELARDAGIPTIHLSSKTHPDEEDRDRVLAECLREKRVDLVILAGYMKRIGRRTLAEFGGRILNIHPALLPKFGGKGMYGMHVHEAVLAAGENRTGVTIHVVDEEYDRGRILEQQSIEVKKDDTPEALAERVLELEHRMYPATIQKIITGDIELN